MVAGRIIPAIASTTATITGLACMQIYSILQNNLKLNNSFINLATGSVLTIDPLIKKNNLVWEKIEIRSPTTLKALIKDLKQKYNFKKVSKISTTVSSIIIENFDDENM